MTDAGTDRLIAKLARAGVGPRMTARLLGLSVAWVCVVRRRLDIRFADPTPEDILAALPPDLRSEVTAHRSYRQRRTAQSSDIAA